MNKSILICINLLLFGSMDTTIAEESAVTSKLVAKAISDIDDDYCLLYLNLNENEQAKSVTLECTAKDHETETHDIKLLKEGILLKTDEEDRKIVVLKSDDFSADRGGHVVFDYLKNGITNSRKRTEVNVQLNREGWQIYKEGKNVNQVKFLTNTVFGKPIGIKRINFSHNRTLRASQQNKLEENIRDQILNQSGATLQRLLDILRGYNLPF